ncbi:MAG: DUF1080 domain-containing protein [Planctomycetota bacterium]|nr:DUF1080 domain-containing protein [Planctomycetota bacterium]
MLVLGLLGCRSAAPAPPAPWTDLLAEPYHLTAFGGEGEVSLEQGVLRLAQGEPLTGVTWDTAVPAGDYELELNATRDLGDDFFVGLTFPIDGEHLTLILGGWGGALCGLSCLDGADASSNDTRFFEGFERGRAYEVGLVVEGECVTVSLDGRVVIDLDTDGRQRSLRTEVGGSVPLGMTSFLTQASYRKLRWRPR